MSNDLVNMARWRTVHVQAPGRLHMGFLDLNGNLGRRFGSIGLTLDGIATEIEVRPATTLEYEGPEASRLRVLAHAAALTRRLGLPSGIAIKVVRAIPDHAGLGSGTQLALALGSALAGLYGLDLDVRDLAAAGRRGVRSGIGIGAFEHGGFLIDGGRGSDDRPPPIILRQDFPAEWRILLIFDRHSAGIHGTREVQAFRDLPEFPVREAERLCRLLLLQALPALAERDCRSFGAAIGELQRTVGDHFSAAQSGRFSSPRVADVLAWLEAEGVSGIGQSSWGPTGFALLGSAAEAVSLLEAARARYAAVLPLHFEVVAARNTGASVATLDEPWLRKNV